MVSLDDYTSRMKEGQEEIYYLTGDSLETIRRSPLLEGFTSRGVEVLLFTDHVDDFWINTVPDYKGKTFKSVTRSNIDLDKFGEGKNAEGEKADEQQDEPTKERIDNLISLLKTFYGEEIKDVRTTGKLTETPACLAIGEGDMDMRMERFLLEHKQLPKKAAKILEINPTHPLIEMMADQVSTQGKTQDVEDMAYLLLDQAKIVEGEMIADGAAFARRLSRFMQKSIAA
jgi:molecular chaperone HtpG